MFQKEIDQHYNAIINLSILTAKDKHWKEYLDAYIAVKNYAEETQQIYNQSSIIDKIQYRIGMKQINPDISMLEYKHNLQQSVEALHRLITMKGSMI